MKFLISKEALKDLELLWVYTLEKWSLEQADRYLNLIMDEIEYLALNPKYGKDFNHIRKGYFRSRVKSHFIFYKINLKDTQIKVVRILHEQMDIESRLNG